MMKHIQALYSLGASLLVSKDQVDPLVQVRRHVLAFQRHPVHQNEQCRIVASPRRKLNMIDQASTRSTAQIQTILESIPLKRKKIKERKTKTKTHCSHLTSDVLLVIPAADFHVPTMLAKVLSA